MSPEVSHPHTVTEQLPSQVNYLAFGAPLGPETLTKVRCHGEDSGRQLRKTSTKLLGTRAVR